MEIIGTDKRSKLVYILQKIRCAPFFFSVDTILAGFPSKAPLVVQAMGLQPIQASLEELHLCHPTRTLARRVGRLSCPGIRGLNAEKNQQLETQRLEV